MSLQINSVSAIPEQTKQVAPAAFPKGNLYQRIREELGVFFTDDQFADLFASQGQQAQAPWRLALVCVFQFAEGLSDRQAAEATRSRIDWKYALGLELTDPGFDFSVLSPFRQRLIVGEAELRLLDTLLSVFKERGLLKAGGRQRTDSTQVLAAVPTLNRLERVGETLRAALNVLADIVPPWLQGQVPVAWYERYGSRMDNYRFPKSDKERETLATQIGTDGFHLLTAVEAATAMPWRNDVPAVVTLREVWAQQFTDPPEPPRLIEAKARAALAELICSPYDPVF